MELTAKIYPPCRCGVAYANHEAVEGHTYDPVASEHCPDGVPVDVALNNLQIVETAEEG